MDASRMFALAATALLCACGVGSGDDDDNLSAGNQSVSAEGKARDGTISVKAPGVDISISVPKELTGEAKAGKDSKVLYPGASFGGIAIAAGEKNNQGGATDVEVHFRTADPPEKVAAWYRDPARDGFRLTSERREGNELVFSGIQTGDRHPFKVTFGPGSGGGTEGRLRVHHTD
jgi:hypothetical protein